MKITPPSILNLMSSSSLRILRVHNNLSMLHSSFLTRQIFKDELTPTEWKQLILCRWVEDELKCFFFMFHKCGIDGIVSWKNIHKFLSSTVMLMMMIIDSAKIWLCTKEVYIYLLIRRWVGKRWIPLSFRLMIVIHFSQHETCQFFNYRLLSCYMWSRRRAGSLVEKEKNEHGMNWNGRIE
jgi:hypothetical protein